jgi:hypothetical protein
MASAIAVGSWQQPRGSKPWATKSAIPSGVIGTVCLIGPRARKAARSAGSARLMQFCEGLEDAAEFHLPDIPGRRYFRRISSKELARDQHWSLAMARALVAFVRLVKRPIMFYSALVERGF